MRIAFLGLGLIGGSIARAVRVAAGADELVAWSPDGVGPRAAAQAGIVDDAVADPTEAIAGAELVLLAGPADAIPPTIDRLAAGGDLARELAPDATVTDVGSTKSLILAAADRAGLPFVGGHPMAGRETAGFDASDAGLFAKRPWVIVPGSRARPRDLERVESLARTCGAEPVRAEARAHDAAVAAVSELPLVVAAALTSSVAGHDDWPGSLARRLAASGWQSATRLARGDPAMGAGMLATNAAFTAERLRDLRAALDEWIAVLDDPRTTAGELREWLAVARAALER